MTLNQKRLAVDPDHNKIPIVRQCELLDLARSSLYYTPCRDTDYNEQLMRLLDEQLRMQMKSYAYKDWMSPENDIYDEVFKNEVK